MSEAGVADATSSPTATTTDPGTAGVPAETAASSPSPEPAASSGPKTWHDYITDPDLREHPFIKQQKDLNALAKEAVTMLPLVGAEKVPLPPKDPKKWTNEQWDKYWTALGRPKTPNEYEFADVELPEELAMSKEEVEDYRKEFHRLGLSKHQVKDLTQLVLQKNRNKWETITSAMEKAYEGAKAELTEEWGDAAPANFDLADRGFRWAAGDRAEELRLKRFANGVELGNDPDVIRMMAKIGATLKEDGMMGDARPGGRFTKTPAEAQHEISKFEHSNREAIYSASHPNHQWAIAERDRLYRMAFPEPEAGSAEQ